jgi:DNA polymerase
MRLEEAGESIPVLGVHDEGVCERKDGVGSLERFIDTMSIVPHWAKGLPIKVEGWSERRYRK